MGGVELLRHARDTGLDVQAEGDRLRIRGPKRLEPLALELLRHKAELLAILWDHDHWARQAAGLLSTVAVPDRRADLRELFEHRAAVCEFDGGQTREDAERIAFSELQAALHRARPTGIDAKSAEST